MPVASGYFIVAALAGMGVPGFASFWAEVTVFISALKVYPVLGVLAICALVLSALYMLRVVQKTFYGQRNERFAHLPDVSFGLGLPRMILVAVMVLFGLFPETDARSDSNGCDSIYGRIAQMKWLIFGPEIYFLAVAAVFLILSMTRPNGRRDFSAALFLAALGVAVTLATVRLEGSLFHGAYRVDLFSQLFKGLLSVGFFLVVCLCSSLNGIHEARHSEFYLLLATCTLGMMLLVSSLELLTLYVALELASYSLYALVPLRSGGGQQMEAGIKYFLSGIATSALMLFGLASLFAATQTTLISELTLKLPALLNTPMAFIGLLLTLCGFFFKLALFPFHIWAPSVYQGAANQVTAFVATATKVTAMAMLVRLVSMSDGNTSLAHVLIALAIVSMTYGNLVALVQKDFKRLLAYSAIAHAGYSLIGILSMNPTGYAAAVFYALAYLAMTFTCFLVVVKMHRTAATSRSSSWPGFTDARRSWPWRSWWACSVWGVSRRRSDSPGSSWSLMRRWREDTFCWSSSP